MPGVRKEASPYIYCAYTLAYLNTYVCTHAYIHSPTHRHMLLHTLPRLGQRHLLHYQASPSERNGLDGYNLYIGQGVGGRVGQAAGPSSSHEFIA